MARLTSRWRFWARRRSDEDFAAEIASHIEIEADQLEREGTPHTEARYAARRAFGNVGAWRERFHDSRRAVAFSNLASDVRHAVRSLSAYPAFTAVGVLSLAIGVSIATGVVAVREASRGRGTPFRNIDRTLALYRTDAELAQGRFGNLPVAALDRVAHESRRIAALGTWEGNELTLRTDNSATLVYVANVSGAVPRILGVRAALGRTFVDRDEQPGAPAIAVLGHRYWRSRFGGDSGIVGRTISLDGRPRLVVGVLEPGVEVPSRVDLWVLRPLRETLADTSSRPGAIALLATGASVSAAEAEISELGAAAGASQRSARRLRTLGAAPFADFLSQDAKGALLLLAMVGIVVGLIAATNFSALVLARGIRRRGELAVRAALGASTGRLVSFMIAECLLIALAGGALGGLLAPALVQSLGAEMNGIFPPWMNLSVSMSTVASAIGLSVGLGIVFGLAPALELARPATSGSLRGNNFATPRQRSGRQLLVAVQVALATGPIVFAAAFFGGLIRLGAPSLGFDQASLYVGTVGASQSDTSWRTPWARESLIDGVRLAPGVTAAAVSHERFLPGSDVRATAGALPPVTSARGVLWNQVTPQFFVAYRPILIAGRLPTDVEIAAGAPVAVVTAATLRALSVESAPGWHLQLRGDVQVTVVGVVSDIRRTGYEQNPIPVVYTGLARGMTVGGWSETLWVRSVPGMNRIVPSVYDALRGSAAGVPLVDFKSSEESTRATASEARSFATIALGVFGVALILASMGIYGTIAYSAVMRRKEVAVRLALGASRVHAARVVMNEAAVQAAVGLVLGIAGGQLATGVVPEVSTPLSVPPFSVVLLATVAFAAVLVVASVGPVRRVWRTDCARALRED